MANQIAVQVYKINSMANIPLGSTRIIAFPSAGIIIRSADEPLGNGIWAYSRIQVIATGTQYYARETRAVLVTAANA